MRSRQTARRLSLVLLCSALAAGCSHCATVRAWQPAGVELADIDRLAIAELSGDTSGALAASLEAALSDGRFFMVVDQSELNSTQHAACLARPAEDVVLAQARERGVDGVILGEVCEFRCEDRPADDHPAWRGSDEADDASAAAPEQHLPHVREASVAVSLRLVDTRTGEVRATRDIRREYHGRSDSEEPLPTREEILATLTDMCVEDFVELLEPHQVEHPMQLASGGWRLREASQVRNGNRLAARGDWDAARDQWQQAVDQNADCDAALFNLAVDAAHRQQYARAEELAMQAIRIRHTDCYAEGLERIRLYRTGYDAVRQQRDRRVLQAAAHAGR